MIVSIRPCAAPLFVFFTVSFCSLGSQYLVAADDVWDGVFIYQKKMADYGNAEAQHKLGQM